MSSAGGADVFANTDCGHVRAQKTQLLAHAAQRRAEAEGPPALLDALQDTAADGPGRPAREVFGPQTGLDDSERDARGSPPARTPRPEPVARGSERPAGPSRAPGGPHRLDVAGM